jgi:hypothetical protein
MGTLHCVRARSRAVWHCGGGARVHACMRARARRDGVAGGAACG